MKKIILRIIFFSGIISIFCLPMYALVHDLKNKTKDQELFIDGNSHFLSGRFGLARESYLKINEKSLVVWQNLGNCFFNEKNYAQALVCWKRAEYGASWKQLSDIFDSEKKALVALHLPLPTLLHDTLKKIVILIPKLFIQVLLFLMLIMLLFFFYSCWSWSSLYIVISYNYKVAWILMLGIIGCSLLWFGKERVFKQGIAIVVKEKVIAYAGPEKSFHPLFQLPLGATVQVVSNILKEDQNLQDQNMHKIYYNRHYGWIEYSFVEIV